MEPGGGEPAVKPEAFVPGFVTAQDRHVRDAGDVGGTSSKPLDQSQQGGRVTPFDGMNADLARCRDVRANDPFRSAHLDRDEDRIGIDGWNWGGDFLLGKHVESFRR